MEIQGFNEYLIYPDGKVFSKKTNKYLKWSMGKNGYYTVSLCGDKIKKITIHRLLAIHYIQNPDNKPLVDHINRIKADNRLENLRWATSTENNNNAKIVKNIIKEHLLDINNFVDVYMEIITFFKIKFVNEISTVEEANEYKNTIDDTLMETMRRSLIELK